MKYVRILLVVYCGVFLLNPAAALAKKAYKGDDAGYLVYSASGIGAPTSFSFLYRRLPSDTTLKWNGSIKCDCAGSITNTYPRKMDYKGYEAGNVGIEKLPPGNYQIYTYQVLAGTSGFSYTWRPAADFSIPFTIQPGKTTYIGNFARFCGCPRFGDMGKLMISDKAQRDLDIARRKEPALPEVTERLFDAGKLESPIIIRNGSRSR